MACFATRRDGWISSPALRWHAIIRTPVRGRVFRGEGSRTKPAWAPYRPVGGIFSNPRKRTWALNSLPANFLPFPAWVAGAPVRPSWCACQSGDTPPRRGLARSPATALGAPAWLLCPADPSLPKCAVFPGWRHATDPGWALGSQHSWSGEDQRQKKRGGLGRSRAPKRAPENYTTLLAREKRSHPGGRPAGRWGFLSGYLRSRRGLPPSACYPVPGVTTASASVCVCPEPAPGLL